jgi:hypothetical protein
MTRSVLLFTLPGVALALCGPVTIPAPADAFVLCAKIKQSTGDLASSTLKLREECKPEKEATVGLEILGLVDDTATTAALQADAPADIPLDVPTDENGRSLAPANEVTP